MIEQGQFERIQLTRTQQDRFGRIRTLNQLKNMDPIEFERFCGYLYERRGYTAHMTASTGDEGVDLLLKKGNELVVVQCKRYSNTVGQPTVRDLYGTMLHNNATSSALVTTARISRQAEDWAKGKPIHLVDGHELISWAKYSRLGGGDGTVGRMSTWVTGNFGRIGCGLAGLLFLLVVAIVVFWGSRLFNTRTTTDSDEATLVAVDQDGDNDDQIIDLGTAPPEPTATENNGRATPTLIPTATIEPTEEASAEPDFDIINFKEPPPLTTDLSAWADVPAIATTLISNEQASWDGTMDVSARWQLGYDDRNLYGIVTVVDDVHVQTAEPRFAYQGDSLEIDIDTNHDRAGSAREDDYQYIISPGNFADLSAGVFRFRGGESGVMGDDWGTNATVVAEQTADGYIIAFRIPWFDMRIGRPTAGTTMGIALSINDLDTPNTALQELTLSQVARQWSNPSSWGMMTLGE